MATVEDATPTAKRQNWIPNQVVWCRWEPTVDRWYPALVIDPNDQWVGLDPVKPNFQHVLWLGDGRISQVTENEMRDFCLCFKECYPKMVKVEKYQKAAAIAVRLAAARADEPLDEDGWVEWATDNLHKFMELSVSNSFYKALRPPENDATLIKPKSKSKKDETERRNSDSSCSGIQDDENQDLLDSGKGKNIPQRSDFNQISKPSPSGVLQKARKTVKKPRTEDDDSYVDKSSPKKSKKSKPAANDSDDDLSISEISMEKKKKPKISTGGGTPGKRVKRAADIDIEVLKVPLDLGWGRDINMRKDPTKKLGDCYYRPPDGSKKLRSMVEVIKYMEANQGKAHVDGLDVATHFCYRETVLTGHANECVRDAAGKPEQEIIL